MAEFPQKFDHTHKVLTYILGLNFNFIRYLFSELQQKITNQFFLKREYTVLIPNFSTIFSYV